MKSFEKIFIVLIWSNYYLLKHNFLLPLCLLVTFCCMASPPTVSSFPQNKEFITRDSNGKGQVFISGTHDGTWRHVQLTVYADTATYLTYTLLLGNTAGNWDFSFEIDGGLQVYSFQMIAYSGTEGTVSIANAMEVVCGDAYIIYGQSNCFGFNGLDTVSCSDFVRTATFNQGNYQVNWYKAMEQRYQLGIFGLTLGNAIMRETQVPVFMANYAVSGASIDYLGERNATNPFDTNTRYGQLLTYASFTGIKNKVRAIVWRQGEYEASSAYPPVFEGYETKLRTLLEGFEADYPAIDKIYLCQNQVLALNGYENGAGWVVREAQRKVAAGNPAWSLISTQSLNEYYDGLHFSYGGHARVSTWLADQIKKELFGEEAPWSATPMITDAYFGNSQRDSVVLVFDEGQVLTAEGMKAGQSIENAFYPDQGARVLSVTALGNKVGLKMDGTVSRLTYLPSYTDSQYAPTGYAGPLLVNQTGIAAAGFHQFPVADFHVLPVENLRAKLNQRKIRLDWTLPEAVDQVEIDKWLNGVFQQSFILPGNSLFFVDPAVEIKAGNTYHYDLRLKAGALMSAVRMVNHSPCVSGLSSEEYTCSFCQFFVTGTLTLQAEHGVNNEFYTNHSITLLPGFQTHQYEVFKASVEACP